MFTQGEEERGEREEEEIEEEEEEIEEEEEREREREGRRKMIKPSFAGSSTSSSQQSINRTVPVESMIIPVKQQERHDDLFAPHKEEGEDHQMVSNVIASAEHEQIDIIGQILAANEEEEGEGNEILRHAQSIIDKFGGSSHKSSSSHSSRSSDVALRDISALLGDSPVLLKVKEKIGAEAEMEGQSSIFSAENNA
ncbi:hypothetical protein ADUPG1_001135, partial [Aduncisulcus paluster]